MDRHIASQLADAVRRLVHHEPMNTGQVSSQHQTANGISQFASLNDIALNRRLFLYCFPCQRLKNIAVLFPPLRLQLCHCFRRRRSRRLASRCPITLPGNSAPLLRSNYSSLACLHHDGTLGCTSDDILHGGCSSRFCLSTSFGLEFDLGLIQLGTASSCALNVDPLCDFFLRRITDC